MIMEVLISAKKITTVIIIIMILSIETMGSTFTQINNDDRDNSINQNDNGDINNNDY